MEQKKSTLKRGQLFYLCFLQILELKISTMRNTTQIMFFRYLFLSKILFFVILNKCKKTSSDASRCSKLWKTLWKLCKTHQNQACFLWFDIYACGKPVGGFFNIFCDKSAFSAFCTKKKQIVKFSIIIRCIKITFQRRNVQKYRILYPL